ncbi:hypothetical protein BJ912DRAFT_1144299 [Pholiota molesta]|nr:hypothetical protein BJ912DRAFT_1144299 [Pholiota molesta]
MLSIEDSRLLGSALDHELVVGAGVGADRIWTRESVDEGGRAGAGAGTEAEAIGGYQFLYICHEYSGSFVPFPYPYPEQEEGNMAQQRVRAAPPCYHANATHKRDHAASTPSAERSLTEPNAALTNTRSMTGSTTNTTGKPPTDDVTVAGSKLSRLNGRRVTRKFLGSTTFDEGRRILCMKPGQNADTPVWTLNAREKWNTKK